MARSSLPPGFRFHPTDVELVKYYLKRKVMGRKFPFEAISELNIYKFSPWDLPDKSCLQSKDREWFFFCPRAKKYANGSRMSRTTETGFWKTTGKDRHVLHNEQTVGSIKTLVFHQGHAPRGERTDWVMHEYRIDEKDLADAGVVQDAYVLCKVFKKNGLGPHNGAQYGAPFKEEEWDQDEEDGPSPQSLPLPNNHACSVSTLVQGSVCGGSLSEAGPSNAVPNNESSSVITSMLAPKSVFGWPLSEAGPSNAVASSDEANLPDELNWLLALLVEDGPLPSAQNSDTLMLDSVNHGNTIEPVSHLDGNDIFNGLGDLGNWADLVEDREDFSSNSITGYALNRAFPADDVAFIELNDLDCPLNCPTAEVGGSESFPTDNLYGNLIPQGFSGHGDHFDAFQKDNVNDNDAGGSAVNRRYFG